MQPERTYVRFCKINTKLHELQIDEETINQIQNLYIETIDIDPSPSDTSEEEFQIDEIPTSSATSDTSTNSKQISVLTQDQEFILEAIKRLDDPQLQKTYLDKLLKDFNKPEHLHLTLQTALYYPPPVPISTTLQRSLTRRNPKPQLPSHNYILRSKPLNLSYKP